MQQSVTLLIHIYLPSGTSVTCDVNNALRQCFILKFKLKHCAFPTLHDLKLHVLIIQCVSVCAKIVNFHLAHSCQNEAFLVQILPELERTSELSYTIS